MCTFAHRFPTEFFFNLKTRPEAKTAERAEVVSQGAEQTLKERVEAFFEQRLPSLPDFEQRPSQRTMALAVAEALESNQKLAIEAETGIGKSIAYLLPLLLRESPKSQPAVIATKTLQLQHQLLFKDLPLLQKLLEAPRTVVQAKGWSNYLCLRKVETPSESARLEMGSHLAAAQAYVANHSTGLSRQEMNIPHRLWPNVQADPLDCQKRDCAQFSRCALFAERRELDKADIIITNHAFLLTDLRLRREGNSLLPASDVLIVDEAHRIDDVATDHLAVRVDQERVFSVIDSPLASAATGWLAAARFTLLAPLPDDLVREWSTRFDHTVHLGLKDLSTLCHSLFTELAALRASFSGASTVPQSVLRAPIGERAANCASELGFQLEEVASRLRKMVFDYELACPSSAPMELSRLSRSLQSLGDDLDFLLTADSSDWVYLCGLDPPNLIARPVDNSQALGNELFDQKDAVIVTSASLRVRNNFHFFLSRTGLSPELTQQMALPSPFEYARSTYVGLSSQGPEPGHQNYAEHLAPPLLSLLLGLQGRTFILTTSHRRVVEYARLLREPLREHGIELLSQGDAPPGHLLKKFRQPHPSVLLGVDTFWEGVDVVGERLSCVVMTRLPFPVPSDPLFQARSELTAQQGGSPFEDLTLPLAALKLRQGFGRLLRSAEDKGIFLLLDPRINTKRYGRTLTRHLPARHAARGSVDELVAGALEWANENLFRAEVL